MLEEGKPDQNSQKKGVSVLLVIGIIVGVIILAVILFMATGVLKFKFKVSRTGQGPTPTPTAAPTAPTERVAGPKSYQSQQYGFSLQYPGNWSLNENPGGQFKLAFKSAPESSTDKYFEFVGVNVADLSAKPGIGLQEVADTWEQQTVSASQNVNFQIIDRGVSTLGGEQARNIVFTAAPDGVPSKGLTRITLKNNKAYIFSYFAEADKYNTFLSQAESILSSVMFQG